MLSDKFHDIQQEQALDMYRKRAQCVKKCEFRKYKEWCKDYMQGHDINQMDMIRTQLQNARNEDKKGQKRVKRHNNH